jgi:hypothetical protein
VKIILALAFTLTTIANPQTTSVTVLASAKTEVKEGLKHFNELKIPPGTILSPKPTPITKEIEVKVIRLSIEGLSTDEFLEKIKEKVGLEEIQKKIDGAGFRPAKIEEVVNVREKLKTTLKDEYVIICGTKAVMNKKDYYFVCDFEYILGTDILTYPPGRFGFIPADWKTSLISSVFAVVKKE